MQLILHIVIYTFSNNLSRYFHQNEPQQPILRLNFLSTPPYRYDSLENLQLTTMIRKQSYYLHEFFKTLSEEKYCGMMIA